MSYQILKVEQRNDYISSIDVPTHSYATGTMLNHLVQGLKELFNSLKLEHWMPPTVGNIIMDIMYLRKNG